MRRALLILVGLGALLVAGAGAYLYLSDEDPPEKRGSAKVEFDENATPEKKKPTRKRIALSWPTFGYDIQRTKVSPYDHRPPFRRTWRLDALDSLEYPPSAAYGN